MANDILKKFDELFGDLDAMTPQKVEMLVHETLKFFEHLKTQLTSGDEKARKEALDTAMELQKKLEAFSKKALEKSGMTQEQLQKFISSPTNFSPDEWRAFQSSQKEISDFEKMNPGKKEDRPPRPPRVKHPKPTKI
ncbi:MAG: hypothetical protein JSR58_06870 [Verrucomicrobia bacterium]|nr:hypothetical protein [Verrucomicrobiota bacterium]